jgi:hypothetical protein
MGFDQRLAKLEDELMIGGGPGLEDQLREALTEAQEHRRQGLPRSSRQWEDPDSPLAQRLQAAHIRAEGLRAWTADGSRERPETPRNGAG